MRPAGKLLPRGWEGRQPIVNNVVDEAVAGTPPAAGTIGNITRATNPWWNARPQVPIDLNWAGGNALLQALEWQGFVRRIAPRTIPLDYRRNPNVED